MYGIRSCCTGIFKGPFSYVVTRTLKNFSLFQPKPKRAKQSQVRASQAKSKGDDSLVLEEEEETTTVVAR